MFPFFLLDVSQSYKSRLRHELQQQQQQQLQQQNRPRSSESGASLELNQAVPPTETLNSEAQKSRAELARQGSLAERNPPASLEGVVKRQRLNGGGGLDHDDSLEEKSAEELQQQQQQAVVVNNVVNNEEEDVAVSLSAYIKYLRWKTTMREFVRYFFNSLTFSGAWLYLAWDDSR